MFGFRFNNPLDNIHWPTALSQLSLGESFNLPLQDVRYVLARLDEELQRVEAGHRYGTRDDNRADTTEEQKARTVAARGFLTRGGEGAHVSLGQAGDGTLR